MLVSFQTLARGTTLAPRSNIELTPPQNCLLQHLEVQARYFRTKGDTKQKKNSLISASAQKWFSNLGVGSK